MTDYSKRSKQLLYEKSNCAWAITEAFRDITKGDGTTAEPAGSINDNSTCDDLCGAIQGIGIVAGKIYTTYKAKAVVAKLTKKFRKKFGALTCRELSPDCEEFQVPVVDRMPICAEYVGYAAEILAQQLREDGII